MNETLPYSDPISVKARHYAHKASYGTCDQVVICANARLRHLFAIALIEWCDSQNWQCNEVAPCQFKLRNKVVIICRSMPTRLFEGVDVDTIQ